MAKCAGCSGSLSAVLHDDTNCIHLTGDGTSSSHLVATLQIDPASPATITCGADGLSVDAGSSGCSQKNMYTVSTVGPAGLGIYLGTTEPFLSCADFIGDGINDDVAIQAAITASYAAYDPAFVLPPEIYLNTGVFTLSSTVDVQGVPLRGAYTTFINTGVSGFSPLKNPGYMTNIQVGEILATFGAAAIKVDTATGFTPFLDNVGVTMFGGVGADFGMIEFDIATGYRIQNCDIINSSGGAVRPGIYENANNSPYKKILANRFTGTTIDFIGISGTNALIDGNLFFGATTSPVTGDRGLINIILDSSFTVAYHSITNNHVMNSPGHGIVIDGGVAGGNLDMCLIHDNLIQGYGAAGVTAYDGIFLSGNANQHDIQQNLCESTQPGARHGINVSAVACDDNFVTNNNLFNSGGGTSFNDSGTNTIAASGNRL
jgi:hypothetical protein